ncbi:hypothetical protein ES708_10410 [subsurface metagenome]
MTFDSIKYITQDGRVVELSEPDDHILQLELDGQIIARFSQTGVTIENILKEVKSIGSAS